MSETTIATAEADARYRTRRGERFEARRLLWRVTKVKRIAYCGRVVTDRHAGVSVVGTGTPGQPGARAGFSGLQSCGSVWSCPVCSEKINARRQSEIQTAIEKHCADGGVVAFATFTLRHKKRDALEPLWDAIVPAFNNVTSGGAWVSESVEAYADRLADHRARVADWQAGVTKLDRNGKPRRVSAPRGYAAAPWEPLRRVGDKETFGIRGWCRVVEVTHGENGWHPHIHALFFLNTRPDAYALEALRKRLYGRWATAVEAAGYDALEYDVHGKPIAVDLRIVDKPADGLSDYFAKNTYAADNTGRGADLAPSKAAYEVTGSQSKTARGKGRTPFQILAGLVSIKGRRVAETNTEAGTVNTATGEILPDESARDLALWRIWEEVSAGRLQLTWSRGLRDELLGGVEETDDEIAAAPLEEDAAPITYMKFGDEWSTLRLWRFSDEILSAAERGDLLDWLADVVPEVRWEAMTTDPGLWGARRRSAARLLDD